MKRWKKGIGRGVWLAGAVVVLVALASPAAGVTIAVVPQAAEVIVGSSLEVDLTISGLGGPGAPSLGVFDLDLAFDPALFSFASVTFGDPLLGDQLDLAGFGSVTDAALGSGSLDLFELSLDPPALLDAVQAGEFTLVTVTLETLGVAEGLLSISVQTLGDAWGDPIGVTAIRDATVSVSAIPEPTAALAFAAGLGVLGLRLRGA